MEKFWRIFLNDLKGQEGKSKEFATFEERQRYTEYMSLIFLGLGVTAAVYGFVVPAVICLAVAARKMWIVVTNKD